MHRFPSDIAFTPTIKAMQSIHGSREAYASMETKGGWETTVTPALAEFLANSDMFYLATSTSEGQPYIQYRGGPMGFLKVVNKTTLGFADFAGNRQFISAGNLSDNPKAFIFLIDYENRRRIKIWGTATVVENDEKLLSSLTDQDYPGKAERAILFELAAWCGNCPAHIHQRVAKRKYDSHIDQLQARIKQLEFELENLRSS